MTSSFRCLAFGLVAASLLVGCNNSGSAGTASSSTPATTTAGAVDPGLSRGTGSASPVKFANLPGTPVQQAADAAVFEAAEKIVPARYGRARSDPFALKGPERAFEIEQNTSRLLGTMGNWVVVYEPAPEKAPTDGLIADPQPYRRLSGIIVGDSVYAIMDGADGNPTIIRPGMKVPNTEWEVVSIDTEKAILRRKGNKTPRQITVRLESPPPGMGGQTNPGFGGPGGPPGQGSGPTGTFGAGSGGGGGGGASGDR